MAQNAEEVQRIKKLGKFKLFIVSNSVSNSGLDETYSNRDSIAVLPNGPARRTRE
jgi:hypothetical protein